jgi:hypothetical protein
MPKVDLKDIFKHGEKFKMKKIDFNSPKYKKMFERVKEEQEESLRHKQIDWSKLDHIYINI